jgi:hypothetical protein
MQISARGTVATVAESAGQNGNKILPCIRLKGIFGDGGADYILQ